jgi:hypothetical protein
VTRGVNELDRFTLAGPMTSRDDDVDTDRRFVNCYPEKLNDDELYVVKRPGLKSSINITGLTTEVPRGCFYWDGNLYSCWGQKIFRGETEIGTSALALTTGRIYFDVSNDNSKLLIHEPGASNSLRTVTTAGSSLTNVSDADFTGLTTEAGLIQLDGYTFVLASDADIHNSDLNDETAWTADNFLNANLEGDSPQNISRHNNYLVYHGSKTTEFFQDVGNATGSPMSRLKGTGVLIGCASAASVVNIERTVFWIGIAHGGGRFVAALEGLQPVSVSTKPVEEALNGAGTDMDNSFAYTCRVGGHSFYVIYIEDSGGDRVFAYDITEGIWSEWVSGASGGPLLVYDAAGGNGVTYMQEYTNGGGNVFEFDPKTYQDDGAGISVEGHTSKWDSGSSHNKVINRLTVVGDMFGTDATDLSISWADDDYQTFVTDRTVDLNDEQAFLTMLGRTRRRSFRYKFLENAPMRLQYFELDYSTVNSYGV